ncbi:hypothetical protein HN803_00225 [candidate division WWE3 bacterium]|nr:hypothetical protein [candidate division WWE3 bacterium]MBT7349211.1 hypothetical protein [candidate division WWE3 bacterium]
MLTLIKNEKGQTIAAVVMVMIIALSVGVSVSTRFIKSLRISSRTDTSSRAVAVAEAAVERILNTDYTDLEDYINFGSCGTACTLQIVGADGVTANATVTLGFAGGTSEDFLVSLREDDTIEVNLQTYPDNTDLNICWDAPPSGELPSVTGMLIHGSDGSGYEADAFSYNSIGSIYGANGFTEAISGYGYSHCALVNGTTDMLSVRVRSIYNSIDAYVVPSTGIDLPSQGIIISSLGVVSDTERQVEVLVSNPYLPLSFDYVLFSKATDNPLSN